jgi:hypothetical protein
VLLAGRAPGRVKTGKARQLIQALRRRFRRYLPTRDEAQRIAVNIARLAELFLASGRVRSGSITYS